MPVQVIQTEYELAIYRSDARELSGRLAGALRQLADDADLGVGVAACALLLGSLMQQIPEPRRSAALAEVLQIVKTETLR